MLFIGIVSDSKTFELVKTYVIKNINDVNLNIINIRKQNIKNIRNIKFDSIIIHNALEKLKENVEDLKKIFFGIKYLILNSDEEFDLEFLKDNKAKIVTYGLNHRATITVSSIREENMLIAIQRDISNIYGELLEQTEKNVSKDICFGVQNILIIQTIMAIYSKQYLDL